MASHLGNQDNHASLVDDIHHEGNDCDHEMHVDKKKKNSTSIQIII